MSSRGLSAAGRLSPPEIFFHSFPALGSNGEAVAICFHGDHLQGFEILLDVGRLRPEIISSAFAGDNLTNQWGLDSFMFKKGSRIMVDNGTLREKVYNYLREELAKGTLTPGSYIDQNLICDHLDISRAPLRDALIQLEAEQFVEIFPRRGVLIKKLSLQDIKNFYEIIGSLESSVLLSEFHKMQPADIAKLEEVNGYLKEALDKNRFDTYYELNLKFHNIFLALSDNVLINHIILPLKQRLYDFPLMKYNRQWELVNLSEHQRFIDSVKAGNREAAASIIKHEHWSFEHHKKNLIKIYRLG